MQTDVNFLALSGIRLDVTAVLETQAWNQSVRSRMGRPTKGMNALPPCVLRTYVRGGEMYKDKAPYRTDGRQPWNGQHTSGLYIRSQKHIWRSKYGVWLTRAKLTDHLEPGHHMIDGIGRTMMPEDSAWKYTRLSLDPHDQNMERTVDVVQNIVSRVIHLLVDETETNYNVVDGVLEICRISESVAMDTTVARGVLHRQNQETVIVSDTNIDLRMPAGQLNKLEWVETEETPEISRLGDDEVLVQVRAVGLTLRDHLIAGGQLNETEFGTECAGIIQEVGSSNSSSLKSGDRVCLIAPGTARSSVRVPIGSVVPIPERLDFSEGSSILVALWLSYYGLHTSNLQQGDAVFIHQGTSCVGQMAIQLAQSLAFQVLVTTSSAVKAKFLEDNFQIPKTNIFFIDDSDVLSKIHRSTDGHGVDLIFGPISGSQSLLPDLTSCLKPLGRLVDTSLTASGVSMAEGDNLVLSNTSRTSISLFSLLQKRPALVQKFLKKAVEAFCNGHLRPPTPIHQFAADNVQHAFSHFDEPQNRIGKRVLELNPGMTVTVSLLFAIRSRETSHLALLMNLILLGQRKSEAKVQFRCECHICHLWGARGPRQNLCSVDSIPWRSLLGSAVTLGSRRRPGQDGAHQ